MGYCIVVFVVSILALVFIPHDAHAVTRSEIYHLEKNINEIRDKIKSYENSIITWKKNIQIYEVSLDEFIEAERIAREWDRFTDTQGSRDALRVAHQNVITAENRLNDAKKEFNRILDLKNTLFVTIQSLEKKLSNDEKILKDNSQTNLAGLTKVIGIELSKTCQIMIINNFPTDCPTYQDLQDLDTSRVESGVFGYHDGFYQRGQPLVKNDHRLYDFEKEFVIVVNPSGNLASRIKMITIENSLDNYFLPYDFVKKDHTRTVNHDRYVDSCKNAVISASEWKGLLPDTIHYLRTGCTVTGYDSVEKITDPITNIDITTSPFYQYTLWLDDTKQKCKGLCKQY